MIIAPNVAFKREKKKPKQRTKPNFNEKSEERLKWPLQNWMNTP